MQPQNHLSGAYVGASWTVLFVGVIGYLAGLWNAGMQLNEKGYYFTVLFFGLFSAVSLQKTVRDRIDGIKVTGIYFGICWAAFATSIILLVVGLWNGELSLSEKGYYGMSFLLALFAAITVQKNVRDSAATESRQAFGPDHQLVDGHAQDEAL